MEGPSSQFTKEERELLEHAESASAADDAARIGQAGQQEQEDGTAKEGTGDQGASAPSGTQQQTTDQAAAAQTTDQSASQPQQGGDLRAALRASRRAEKRAREEAERLRKDLEDARAGKAQTTSTDISDEELAQMEIDFPLQAKLVRKQREQEQELAALRQRAAPQPEFEPVLYDPDVQEIIDSVPDLVAWQYDPQAQDKFIRAIEHDKLLLTKPEWQGKPDAERFAEAARLVKAETTPATRIDTAQLVANLPTQQPRQISDFRGGARPDQTLPDYTKMTDDQIMASLPR